MNPRGVTLVELLAAISIVVIVTALSIPALHLRMAGARMDAACGQIEAAVIASRAESVRRGTVLELGARNLPGGTELVVRELESAVQSSLSVGEVRGNGRESLWGVLHAGVRVLAAPAQDPKAESQTPAPKPESFVRIAVFCPDGTTALGGDCRLSDGKSELTIAVNAWIGGAAFAPPAAKEGDAPEAPDEEPIAGAAG